MRLSEIKPDEVDQNLEDMFDPKYNRRVDGRRKDERDRRKEKRPGKERRSLMRRLLGPGSITLK